MTTEEKQEQMLQAMDRLWGALEYNRLIVETLIDIHDYRLEMMNKALSEAQDILMPLLEK